MSGEPRCRGCYLEAMGDDERRRFLQDEVGWRNPAYPPTCIYYCPRHQAEQDAIMAKIPWDKLVPVRDVDPGEFMEFGGAR